MKFIVLFFMGFLSHGALADPVENRAFLYSFLEGSYVVIGRGLDTNRTYQGIVVLTPSDGHFEVRRIINGKLETGVGSIEHAAGNDQANVLRVRFSENGQEFEATYLWRADLDNYARLSGYVYRPGQKKNSPGIEALFIDRTVR